MSNEKLREHISRALRAPYPQGILIAEPLLRVVYEAADRGERVELMVQILSEYSLSLEEPVALEDAPWGRVIPKEDLRASIPRVFGPVKHLVKRFANRRAPVAEVAGAVVDFLDGLSEPTRQTDRVMALMGLIKEDLVPYIQITDDLRVPASEIAAKRLEDAAKRNVDLIHAYALIPYLCGDSPDYRNGAQSAMGIAQLLLRYKDNSDAVAALLAGYAGELKRRAKRDGGGDLLSMMLGSASMLEDPSSISDADIEEHLKMCGGPGCSMQAEYDRRQAERSKTGGEVRTN